MAVGGAGLSGWLLAVADEDQRGALDLARRLLGPSVAVTAVATPGMETRAWRVAGADRTGCLRIGTHLGRGLTSFAKDVWAAERYGTLLPVPEVWELGEDPYGLAFCLTAWVPGVTLQDLDAAGVSEVLPELFALHDALAGTPTDDLIGYGVVDAATGRAPYPSWRSTLLAALDATSGWQPEWAARNRAWTDRVLQTFVDAVERCPEVRGPVHGDWGANNVLVHQGRISGIIDWEAAGVGDPSTEIGGRFWCTWPPVATCMTLSAAFAAERADDRSDHALRLLAHDLWDGLGEVTSGLAEGDVAHADWALGRLLELVER